MKIGRDNMTKEIVFVTSLPEEDKQILQEGIMKLDALFRKENVFLDELYLYSDYVS